MLGFEETIVQRIYLDHNATTPLLPAVIDRMTEELREDFGNPSSVHHFGQQAKAAIDEARTNVANLIGANPSEVLFTSGGTEADNIAVRARPRRWNRRASATWSPARSSTRPCSTR